MVGLPLDTRESKKTGNGERVAPNFEFFNQQADYNKSYLISNIRGKNGSQIESRSSVIPEAAG